MANEITVGIAGAAGDGLDRSGDTLARTAARLGLHVFTYNSYQSIIRGGHTWLKLRLSEDGIETHGDHLHVLIALNQDSIERHASSVEPGGAIIYNSDKLRCDGTRIRDGVHNLALPVKELTKDLGRLLPVMQNTVALGALLHLIGLDREIMLEILKETFSHKGEEIIHQNLSALKAGFDHAAAEAQPLGCDWTFTSERRPIVTGNQMIAMGAVAAGCKFYTAYPMSPATSILHWMASHTRKCGIVVKQAEDELAVANIAIGAGYAGVRAMCATSGGGFALMTEAIGMAAMIEAPVVIVNVMRGGPSTGLPTKTEQADLNQAVGASQGDFPRMIVAPRDAADCFHTAAEAHNVAEKFQIPVILLTDLLQAEARSTIDCDAITPDVEIDRGEWVTELADGETYSRYALTPSGISPRARPGVAGLIHVAGTDEHDQRGILISDEHTNAAIRRKMHEKRMRKMAGLLAQLPPPVIEGPEDADVTLIGWGSTWGVIQESVRKLADDGITANSIQIKYLIPFHESEARALFEKCKRTIVVEHSFDGQFARHLRAETGFTVDDIVVRYDGEPFQPTWVKDRVKAILAGEDVDLAVTEAEAREMAYHHVRIYMGDKSRPGDVTKADGNGYGEAVWEVQIVDRAELTPKGTLVIGTDTGAIHDWHDWREE